MDIKQHEQITESLKMLSERIHRQNKILALHNKVLLKITRELEIRGIDIDNINSLYSN